MKKLDICFGLMMVVVLGAVSIGFGTFASGILGGAKDREDGSLSRGTSPEVPSGFVDYKGVKSRPDAKEFYLIPTAPDGSNYMIVDGETYKAGREEGRFR